MKDVTASKYSFNQFLIKIAKAVGTSSLSIAYFISLKSLHFAATK